MQRRFRLSRNTEALVAPYQLSPDSGNVEDGAPAGRALKIENANNNVLKTRVASGAQLWAWQVEMAKLRCGWLDSNYD